jgi:hypothetical protein
MAKVSMSETEYYKSGKHLDNILIARERERMLSKHQD